MPLTIDTTRRISVTDEHKFQTTPYRWFILLQYVFVTLSSGFMMITFSSVAVTTSKVYNVSLLWVNTCIMFFLLSFVVLNFLSIHLIEKMGLKKTVS